MWSFTQQISIVAVQMQDDDRWHDMTLPEKPKYAEFLSYYINKYVNIVEIQR